MSKKTNTTIERLTEELESERRMRIEEESLHARTEVLQAEAISRLTEERARWALRWLEMLLELLENPDNEWMTEELRPLLNRIATLWEKNNHARHP